MKIGILTYHKANNYGAVLQAYALQKHLQRYYNDVKIVDYWPKHHAIIYDATLSLSFRHLFLDFKKNIRNIIQWISKKKRNQRFDAFRKEHLEVSPYLHSHFDIVFYGSDTIWNKWNQNNLFQGFDTVYWGDSTISSKYKFAYGPSMGNTYNDENARTFCKRFLANFNRISVREVQLKVLLESWGFKDIIHVVDPTILLEPEQWASLCPKRIIQEDYILCYNLEEVSLVYDIAKKISKDNKLRCVFLSAKVKRTLPNRDYYDTAGPLEFLSLFNYASYVVTSSFHGCVFSVIFRKQFYFNSSVETERIESLLLELGIENRFVKTNLLPPDCDYEPVLEKLKIMRSKSFDYIEKCFESVDR